MLRTCSLLLSLIALFPLCADDFCLLTTAELTVVAHLKKVNTIQELERTKPAHQPPKAVFIYCSNFAAGDKKEQFLKFYNLLDMSCFGDTAKYIVNFSCRQEYTSLGGKIECALLVDAILQACKKYPRVPIFLLGYSLGASVILNMLHTYDEEQVFIRASFLFAPFIDARLTTLIGSLGRFCRPLRSLTEYFIKHRFADHFNPLHSPRELLKKRFTKDHHFFFVHGTNDHMIPIFHSEQLCEILQNAGHNVVGTTLGCGHQFNLSTDEERTLKSRASAFVQQLNKHPSLNL